MESARVLLWLLLGALTGMEGGVEIGNGISAGKGQGNPGSPQRMRGKVSPKRSATRRSFLLIERLILLMMGL